MTAQLGRSPTVPELAACLDADEEEIIEAELATRGYQPTSLFQPLSTDDGAGTLMDLMGETDVELERVDFHVSLPPLLARLPEREQKIVAMRFFGNQSQPEIARTLGISQMHVSRLLSRALEKMRVALDADG
jgi:RNA polymerase sigma-B factor